MKNKKYHIEHLGKTLHTDHWVELSTEICDSIREQYYEKPDFELVKKNLKSVCNGGTVIADITRYYVKDLMANVKLFSPLWSISEVLQSDELIRYFYSRILSSEKVYPPESPLIKRFETALRISGGGVAMKPSNFPMKVVDNILKKYNINGKYYDFSCGWGVRMLSSMKHNIEYYGTDPNHELVGRLLDMSRDYNEVNTNIFFDDVPIVDIRAHGSEIIVPEWINTIGVAFSSPPYFTLEDYRIGNQSINNRTYEVWLNEYMLATLENIKAYLIDGGYLLINIKNFSKYALYDDTFALCKSIGLTYVETLTLDNITRPSAKPDISTDESIMVFRKIDS